MLYEGNVLACIQIVDEVSISTSVNFTIHVLIDPNDGSTFEASDDYSEFQKAVIRLASVEEQARKQMADQKIEFEDMQLAFMNVQEVAGEAKDAAKEAREISENALGVANEALETIEDFTTLVKELQEKEQQNEENIADLKETVDGVSEKTDLIADNISDVAAAVREVAEKITNIKCECGLKEEEVVELITQALTEYVTKEDAEAYATLEQLANYATLDALGELDTKLEVAVEEAQGEHRALWDALQFVDFGIEEG